MQVRKQQLELDMEQQTVSRLGKEYVKAVYCHPAYLTSMQNISCEMLGWMKHNLESRLLGEISITSDTADDTTFMAEGEEELKSLLKKVKEESEKAGLTLSIQKIGGFFTELLGKPILLGACLGESPSFHHTKAWLCCEMDEWSQVWFTNKVSQLNSGKKQISIYTFIS